MKKFSGKITGLESMTTILINKDNDFNFKMHFQLFYSVGQRLFYTYGIRTCTISQVGYCANFIV